MGQPRSHRRAIQSMSLSSRTARLCKCQVPEARSAMATLPRVSSGRRERPDRACQLLEGSVFPQVISIGVDGAGGVELPSLATSRSARSLGHLAESSDHQHHQCIRSARQPGRPPRKGPRPRSGRRTPGSSTSAWWTFSGSRSMPQGTTPAHSCPSLEEGGVAASQVEYMPSPARQRCLARRGSAGATRPWRSGRRTVVGEVPRLVLEGQGIEDDDPVVETFLVLLLLEIRSFSGVRNGNASPWAASAGTTEPR